MIADSQEVEVERGGSYRSLNKGRDWARGRDRRGLASRTNWSTGARRSQRGGPWIRAAPEGTAKGEQANNDTTATSLLAPFRGR